MSRFADLYNMILTSKKSREDLLKDPAGMLESLNIEPTPEILEAVCTIILEVKLLQEKLGATKPEMKTCVS